MHRLLFWISSLVVLSLACGADDPQRDGGPTTTKATDARPAHGPGTACSTPNSCAPNPELLCRMCAERGGTDVCVYACKTNAECPEGETCVRPEGSYDAQGCIDRGVEAPWYCE